MSRQLANLISAYRDLADRYGADDPIVVQLKEDVDRRTIEVDVLPFGERRKTKLAPHLWSQRLRRDMRMSRERPSS